MSVEATEEAGMRDAIHDGHARYYVDERVGCIAVVDSEAGKTSPGLGPDYTGVVKYWPGSPTPWLRLRQFLAPNTWISPVYVPRTDVLDAEHVAAVLNALQPESTNER